MLEDKVIAITGAGRGIGRAVALACAAEGAKVVVNDYGVSMDGSEPSSEVAEQVVKEIQNAGGEAVPLDDGRRRAHRVERSRQLGTARRCRDGCRNPA
jgi:NAD(P)-dependent dehydrogenase (short-subunit alcohol dehydrogenase family)